MAIIQKEEKEKKDKSTFKLTCIVTGKTLSIVRSYYEKKVTDYGSEESLHNLYVCKQAKGMLKRGYSVEEIQSRLGKPADAQLITPGKIAQILGKQDTEEITVPTILDTVNIPVRPEVAAFINNLKNYQPV